MSNFDPNPVRTACTAAAGVIAVGAALAVGELAAVPISPDASAYFAVGSTVVDHTPAAVREWAISTFGTGDKTALFIGMGVIIAIIGAGCGLAERRRAPAGSVIIAVFALVGVLAALGRPNASLAHTVPSIVAGGIGVVVLHILIGQLPWDDREPNSVDDRSSPPSGVSRRFFLIAGGVVAVAAAAGTIGRRMLASKANTIADRARLVLPVSASPAAPIPAGTDLDVDGVTPFVTSNGGFYRVDTALQVPALTTADWALHIHGMVDEEVTISWAELLAMPMTERVVTLTCVSNEVGGDLVGNARWLGVPMKDLLERAGVRPGADMLMSTSSDGWTCGTPVSAVTDGRDAMLVIGMNGEPLPIEHGYPVRQVIPGLYGYVSATKWVVDWELTKFSAAKAYWSTRGWSELGPIKLSSRIDRPASGSKHPAGAVVVAGTAWAQHTGVDRVEVRIDEGPWRPAELATEYSLDTWRQWKFVWQATSGDHDVECRAIDKKGNAQSAQDAPPAPDGATGLDVRTYAIT